MRDVLLRVIVVLAVMLACITPAPGQTAPKAKAKVKTKVKTASAFEQLSNSQLREYVRRLGMRELLPGLTIAGGTKPAEILERAKVDAEVMRKISDPAACLARGEEIIATLEEAVALAEKDMETAEQAAEKAPEKTKIKTDKLILAAKAAHLYYEILYLLGDLAGRQAIGPYVNKMIYLQDNREDRKTVLKTTEGAVLDLGDMQADLKETLRDWQEEMSVWMIMGSRGEILLRTAQYWSTQTYLNRAMALGDAEVHESEREELRGAFRRLSAHISRDTTGALQKLKDKLTADLTKLAADQKKRTDQRRELLGRVLMLLPKFETTRRFGVTHDARRRMSIANRELGEYKDAIDGLAPARYEDASGRMKVRVAMELPITLVKQGKYSETSAVISQFKEYAETITAGKGKKLTEIQQAQIDLNVAMLKEYLARRWAAASATPSEKAKQNAEGQAAMVEFLDKYEDEGIRRSFIDFFGNRLLYTEDVEQLGSVQLYIVASGASARKEPGKRRAMLETLLARKDDPATKKLAPEAHWQLALTLNVLGRQMDSADHFISVVTLLGADHPRSPLAAQNASICMDKYATWYETTRKTSIPRAVRLKFVTALTHAVSFDSKKNAELKLFNWYYDLGRQCDRLSQESCPAEEVVPWMRRAADAFSKVPSDPPGMFFSAQDMWLDLRYRALKRAEKKDAKLLSDAVKLREDLGVFIQRIEKYVEGLADKDSDEAKGLAVRAAWSDFTRAKLLAEQLHKEALALTEVEALLKKWSKVDGVVVAATQWKIQNLIDLDKITEASAELQAFKKANEQRPDVWTGLIREVIEGIQKAIGQAQAKRGNEAKLTALRKNYLQLAEILYAPIKGKPLEGADGKVDNERLTLTQLWIDALVQNDKGSEAMELASGCRKIFTQRREVLLKKIEAKYAPVIGKCRAAIGLPVALNKLVAGFVAEVNRLAKQGFDDFNPAEDVRPVLMMQKTMNDTAKDADAAKKKRRMSSLSRELITGYREIIRRLKNRIPVDTTVEWNIAKCLSATAQYNASLKIYQHLIEQTDPRTGKDSERRFWRLQLEYCQTYLKAFSKDKELMGKLVTHIEKELSKVGGGELGGFKVQFFAIREKARRLSK